MKSRPSRIGFALAALALASTGLIGLFNASARGNPVEDKPQVIIETSMGNIVVELDPAATPKTVENFLKYVDDHFYDGTIFHRVIEDFMIQGGGMTPDMKEKETRPPIQNESLAKNPKGISNERGTIAMARTGDPNSATSQFFINHKDNLGLDRYQGQGYAAFGKVVAGMDVVDKIAKVETVDLSQTVKNVPKTAVVIKSIKRKAKS